MCVLPFSWEMECLVWESGEEVDRGLVSGVVVGQVLPEYGIKRLKSNCVYVCACICVYLYECVCTCVCSHVVQAFNSLHSRE